MGDVALESTRVHVWESLDWWRRIGRVAFGSWLATGCGFVGTIVAARGLGVESYGAVVLATSITTALAILLDFSLEDAVVHHGFRALAEADPGRLRALLRTSLIVDVLVGVAVFVLLLVFAAPLASFASRDRLDPSLIRLAALGMLGETANGTTGGALLIARRPDLRAWSMAVTNVYRLILVAGAVHMGGAEAVLVAFAVAAALGAATQGALAWRVAWRTWPKTEDRSGSDASFSSLFKFGFHSSLTTSIFAIQGAVLPVLLGRLSGPAAVGLLKVAHLPISLTAIATAPLSLAIYPEQARLAGYGSRTALLNSVKFHALLGLAVGVPAGIIGWFSLPWLLPALYSESFKAAVAPARILLVVAVVYLVAATTKTLPSAVGQPAMRTLAAIVDLTLLVLFLMLLGRQGVVGAATALAAVTLLHAVFLWFAIPRILRTVPLAQHLRGGT